MKFAAAVTRGRASRISATGSWSFAVVEVDQESGSEVAAAVRRERASRGLTKGS